MTSFVFSISVLCLAAINNEQLAVAPQELLSAKFQEQFTGSFQRIRNILLRETRYQRTILRKTVEQPRRYACGSSALQAISQPLPGAPPSYPRLLVDSSRPIRAPAA